MNTTIDSEYRSELLRELDARSKAKGEAQGKAKGEAQGKAKAVLTVLDARGVAVPTDARERILACTDLPQLDTWLRRAVTATTLDDVLQK